MAGPANSLATVSAPAIQALTRPSRSVGTAAGTRAPTAEFATTSAKPTDTPAR
ncbi:hypothetical protein FHR32_000264 [Streptosporangium album]|uniref:Uncharacterized protein n=1 Tax=Streptosporangium album TaxID=47479 RepID=A0A7W7RPT3_9ACTN|nr:hypothetical protein [Streptosporangium album]MBB4935959.1 hypothetical protein [Streptosporangium album]